MRTMLLGGSLIAALATPTIANAAPFGRTGNPMVMPTLAHPAAMAPDPGDHWRGNAGRAAPAPPPRPAPMPHPMPMQRPAPMPMPMQHAWQGGGNPAWRGRPQMAMPYARPQANIPYARPQFQAPAPAPQRYPQNRFVQQGNDHARWAGAPAVPYRAGIAPVNVQRGEPPRAYDGNNRQWTGDHHDGDRRDGDRRDGDWRDGNRGHWDGDHRDGGWDRDWRRDQRYDWHEWREQNRDAFHIGIYYAPYRDWYYQPFSVGVYVDPVFYGQQYWIDDPWDYRLPPAYGPYRWVRYYDDVLLIDVRNGYVVDVIHDFFW